MTSQHRRQGTNVRQINYTWRVRIACVLIYKRNEALGRERRLTKALITHQGHEPLHEGPLHHLLTLIWMQCTGDSR